MVTYCDDHQVPLDGDGACLTTSPAGAPQWHRPGILDTYEVPDRPATPSPIALAMQEANEARRTLRRSLGGRR